LISAVLGKGVMNRTSFRNRRWVRKKRGKDGGGFLRIG